MQYYVHKERKKYKNNDSCAQLQKMQLNATGKNCERLFSERLFIFIIFLSFSKDRKILTQLIIVN